MNPNQLNSEKIISAIETILSKGDGKQLLINVSENIDYLKNKVNTLTDETINEIKSSTDKENLSRLYEILSSIK